MVRGLGSHPVMKAQTCARRAPRCAASTELNRLHAPPQSAPAADKDLFSEFYRKKLARRLLHATSGARWELGGSSCLGARMLGSKLAGRRATAAAVAAALIQRLHGRVPTALACLMPLPACRPSRHSYTLLPPSGLLPCRSQRGPREGPAHAPQAAVRRAVHQQGGF